MSKLSFFILFLGLTPLSVSAQLAAPSPWRIHTNLETRTSLESPEQNTRDLTTSLDLIITNKISDNERFMFRIIGTKELTNDRETSLSNGFFGYTNKFFQPVDEFSVSAEGRIYIPTNKDSRNDESLYTRAYGALRSSYRLDQMELSNVTLAWKISTYRNFQQYKRNSNGAPNTAYGLSNLLSLDIGINDKLSFGSYIINSHRWDHENIRKNDTFELGNSLNYQIEPHLGLEFGHTLGGNTFKTNGVDSNVKLFNSEDSTLYTEIEYSF